MDDDTTTTEVDDTTTGPGGEPGTQVELRAWLPDQAITDAELLDDEDEDDEDEELLVDVDDLADDLADGLTAEPGLAGWRLDNGRTDSTRGPGRPPGPPGGGGGGGGRPGVGGGGRSSGGGVHLHLFGGWFGGWFSGNRLASGNAAGNTASLFGGRQSRKAHAARLNRGRKAGKAGGRVTSGRIWRSRWLDQALGGRR